MRTYVYACILRILLRGYHWCNVAALNVVLVRLGFVGILCVRSCSYQTYLCRGGDEHAGMFSFVVFFFCICVFLIFMIVLFRFVSFFCVCCTACRITSRGKYTTATRWEGTTAIDPGYFSSTRRGLRSFLLCYCERHKLGNVDRIVVKHVSMIDPPVGTSLRGTFLSPRHIRYLIEPNIPMSETVRGPPDRSLSIPSPIT